MSEEYVLPAPERLSMSLADADKLLAAASGDAALLYIYILRCGGRLDPEQARQELGLGDRLDAAMAVLAEAGLIQARKGSGKRPPLREREDAPPNYTVADVKARVDAGSDFSLLLEEVAKRLGRVLSGGDMTILFGIYDYLGLPTEVILLLISWCVQEQERRYGAGKKPSLRQIEKEAYLWARNELFTLDAAERHLAALEERRSRSGEVRRLLGIRERPLSPTEEKYVMSWLEMGFPGEAILEAYDRTILNKKELVWPYMNRILESWHKKGLHSLSEISAGDQKPRAGKAAAKAEAKPEASEYARMQKYLDKLNGGGAGGTGR